jgi:hypothetical protein
MAKVLPHRWRLVALRWLRLPNRRIAVTYPYLSWLGIDYDALAYGFARRGFCLLTVPEPQHWGRLASRSPIPPGLRDALRYAVAVETEEVKPNLAIGDPLVELWTARLADLFTTTEALFRRKRPELVVLVQGFEPVNAVARAAALELGIPMIAIENTALKTRLLWDNISAVTTNRNLAASFFWRHQGTVSRTEVEQFTTALMSDLRVEKSAEHLAPVGASAADDGRRNVLFIGQVLTDSSLVFGLGAWGSPLDIIESAVQWCQRNGYRLLVKLHPKESTGGDPITYRPYEKLTVRKMQVRPQLMAALAANDAVVDADNQFDTYALIAQSDIAITVNSQAGLEASLFGKATVVCGDCFYGGLGFTLDAKHPAQFDVMMERAKHFDVPYAAKEFAFTFYQCYCRPKTAPGLVELVAEQLVGCRRCG